VGLDDLLAKTQSLLQMVDDWRTFLSEDPTPDVLGLLRHHDATGRPLGNQESARRLEAVSRRVLRKAKPGPMPARKGN